MVNTQCPNSLDLQPNLIAPSRTSSRASRRHVHINASLHSPAMPLPPGSRQSLQLQSSSVLEENSARHPSFTATLRAASGPLSPTMSGFPQRLRSILPQTSDTLFTGRIGSNQAFTVDPLDEGTGATLDRAPNASRARTLTQCFNMRPLRSWDLWRAAALEGIGTMMLVYLTGWASISPNVLPEPPSARFGVFDNASFIGSTIAGVQNFILFTLFIFTFSISTGAHLNPGLTFAMLLTGLCSFPRAVAYIFLQTLGGAVAGKLLHVSFGSRNFKCGGCFLFEPQVSIGSAVATEFVFNLALYFLAFGVGLDPRQRDIIGPTLGPFLVGMVAGVLTWAAAYSRYGYGGASMNPARCFGVFVGSSFPTWHWLHWVVPMAAGIVFAAFQLLAPPVTTHSFGKDG